jgi:NAD+ diphosphatase
LLTYTGGWLDRAGGRRADPKWLDALLNSPDATLIPFWRDQCLVSGDPPVPVTLHAARADGAVFLGLDADGHLLRSWLAGGDELAPDGAYGV